MTTEPNGTAADDTDTPAPDTAPHTPADTPTITVRRAAAQALEHLAHAVDDKTSTTSLLAAITEQADATGRAHGLATGSWHHDRVGAMAIVALFATTVTTEEAADVLRHLGTHEVARRLGLAAEFLRP
jgi:hypothetical protein